VLCEFPFPAVLLPFQTIAVPQFFISMKVFFVVLWPCVFVQGSDNYMLGDDGFSKASFPAIFNWRCG